MEAREKSGWPGIPGGLAGFSRKFSTAPWASTLRMPKELASAPVPAADHDLLGRHGVDELAQVGVHDVPGGPQVLVQGEAAVLGEDVDAADAGGEGVGQGES